MYHFLSGYRRGVAGTEKASPSRRRLLDLLRCALHAAPSTVYARAGEKMARQNVKCWLVNTAVGGGFGVGERMAIRHTRAMGAPPLTQAGGGRPPTDPPTRHAGAAPVRTLPTRCWEPPRYLEGQTAYDSAARDVARRFEKNFRSSRATSTQGEAGWRSAPPPDRPFAHGRLDPI